jgi:hypothetical protein
MAPMGYKIEPLDGERNIWADMLSRWGGRPAQALHQPAQAQAQATWHWTTPFTATTNEYIVHWPKIETIKQAQAFTV